MFHGLISLCPVSCALDWSAATMVLNFFWCSVALRARCHFSTAAARQRGEPAEKGDSRRTGATVSTAYIDLSVCLSDYLISLSLSIYLFINPYTYEYIQ